MKKQIWHGAQLLSQDSGVKHLLSVEAVWEDVGTEHVAACPWERGGMGQHRVQGDLEEETEGRRVESRHERPPSSLKSVKRLLLLHLTS